MSRIPQIIYHSLHWHPFIEALHCDDRKHPMCAIQFEGGVQLRITSRERSILPTRPFIHNAVFRVGKVQQAELASWP
ncbi:hypothetical protein OUZ56_006891 [Daphnia magna]|uniref:Uncharacterized protein n=1 Tax=Daphnia magna TaxID=35525 RepID=A0ABQ9YY84_9CRUS|nr:hypothetical protein OUZ56_006891 [Daphnia magna]